MRRLALRVLAWCDHPTDDPIQSALVAAFATCGLPSVKATDPRFDVARTGKLNDVLDHASAILQRPHPLRTVADVTRFLSN
jgi:hypothetical protein